MLVRRPEKREAMRDRVNVFVSKAAPVETRVILRDPTLSSRTYFASFRPLSIPPPPPVAAAAVISYVIFYLPSRIFHRDSFSPLRKM